ncbi:RNA-directed DNA polymerase [Escherichia coli]
MTLRALCECLTEIYPNSRLKLPHTVIDLLKNALNSDLYAEYAKIDLKSFYPSIEHKLIFNAIKIRLEKEIRQLITSSLIVPTVSGSTGSKGVPNNTRGVPQGLAISNILAEISLSDFDNEINKMHDIWYMRYVDDILILTQKIKQQKLHLISLISFNH